MGYQREHPEFANTYVPGLGGLKEEYLPDRDISAYGLGYQAPADAGKREWDAYQRDNPLVDLDAKGRRQPGLRRKYRRERNGQVYDGHDPEMFCPDGPSLIPPEVQTLFEEVFAGAIYDSEGRLRLKLALDPHTKRCTMYELSLEERGYRWRRVYVAQERPVEGYLPVDLRGDPELAHHTGKLGDFKWPEREELEAVQRTDKKVYGVDAVEEYLHAFEREEEREKDRKMFDLEYGLIDYYANMQVDEMNQLFGSGQHMRSVATVMLRSNPAKWQRIQRNGYVEIRKRAKGEYEQDKLVVLDSVLHEWKTHREASLSRFWTPTDEQLADALARLAPLGLDAVDLLTRAQTLRFRFVRPANPAREEARKDIVAEAKAAERARLRAAYEGMAATEKVKDAAKPNTYRALTSRELARIFRAQRQRVGG